MAKKSKSKAQKIKPTICPIFEAGRNIGGWGDVTIAVDMGGLAWRIDCSTGEARPVKFAAK